MSTVKLLNAIESPLVTNGFVRMEDEKALDCLSLGVRAEILRAAEVDQLGVRFFVLVKMKEQSLLSYYVILTFSTEDWPEKVSDVDSRKLLAMKDVHEMLETTVGFARGSLFARVKDTPFEWLSLPVLSVEELLDNIRVVDSESVSV